MQPPLTDLSWVTWAIFADWCADYRPKGEAFARKVVKSLRKMEAVGCDPKMGLYGRSNRWPVEQINPLWYGFHLLLSNSEAPCSALHSIWWGRVHLNGHKAISPAALPTHWQDTRLAWKFWKCVNRRALGIRDAVLGE